MTSSLNHELNRCILSSFGLIHFFALSYSLLALSTNSPLNYTFSLLNRKSILKKVRAEAQPKYDQEIVMLFVNEKAILAKAESDSIKVYRKTAKYPELAIKLKKD